MAVKNYGIHDKWTDLDKLNNVDIKSVDGVIESVKINGEEAGGGGGSSDFSTAEVTVNNNTEAQFLLCVAFDDDGDANSGPVVEVRTGIVQAILYKGMAIGLIPDEGVTVSTSGAAEYEDSILIITGNCTITIS